MGGFNILLLIGRVRLSELRYMPFHDNVHIMLFSVFLKVVIQFESKNLT